MNNNWEKEGLKYLEKIFGEGLFDKEFENNLKENADKEPIISILKPIIKLVGISSKLGEELEQNTHLGMSPQNFFEMIFKQANRIFEEHPKIKKQLEEIGKNIVQGIQSLDLYKKLLSVSMDNEFENLIKKRFLEELDEAERVSKNEVVRSFKLALNYVKHQQQPDQLFVLSSYNKLGIRSGELKTDTIANLFLSFMKILSAKKQLLFKLSDDEFVDQLNEIVSRLARAIEPYLKVIIVSIYNLQKISKKEKVLDQFKAGFGYYLSRHLGLNISRIKKPDYIDYRNAITHNNYKLSFNRKSEEVKIIFNIKRESKGRTYWSKTKKMGLEEFERLFRDFRKFQRLFFSFYEIYIKLIDKNYQYQFSPLKDFFLLEKRSN